MVEKIPTEVYLGFLGKTIEIHWDYHAFLMVGIWFGLVPLGVVAIRFFKPKPTTYGIAKGTGKLDKRLLWWTIHFYSLYLAIGLSLVGMVVVLAVSGGFSGTLHALFGLGTILFGSLQIISSWFRGSHGGKNGIDSDPGDPSTWGGDHFDMTPKRRWFEAYHKTAGYFSLALALGAVVSGLLQYWILSIAVALAIVFIGVLAISVFLEGRGYRQDTYRSVYGDHPDNPYNKSRIGTCLQKTGPF